MKEYRTEKEEKSIKTAEYTKVISKKDMSMEKV